MEFPAIVIYPAGQFGSKAEQRFSITVELYDKDDKTDLGVC